MISEKFAALLMYLKWSRLEQRGEYTAGVAEHIPLHKYFAYSPWCELHNPYKDRVAGVNTAPKGCSGCPLDKAGQCCFGPGSWAQRFYAGGKAAMAGNIARVAWQEYKRLGG